jgi:uncharacterized membrane protein YfcA
MRILDFCVGVATGIISGFGIGGGSLLVLYLTAVTGMSQYTAGGINLLYFIGCAPAALIGHIRNKLVDWRAVLWCVASGIALAIPTSLLADNLNNDWLRRLFGILLLYIGIRELRLSKKKQ